VSDYLAAMLGDNPQQTWIDIAIASAHLKGHDVAVVDPNTGETEIHRAPETSQDQ